MTIRHQFYTTRAMDTLRDLSLIAEDFFLDAPDPQNIKGAEFRPSNATTVDSRKKVIKLSDACISVHQMAGMITHRVLLREVQTRLKSIKRWAERAAAAYAVKKVAKAIGVYGWVIDLVSTIVGLIGQTEVQIGILKGIRTAGENARNQLPDLQLFGHRRRVTKKVHTRN